MGALSCAADTNLKREGAIKFSLPRSPKMRAIPPGTTAVPEVTVASALSPVCSPTKRRPMT
jgi:hypothetical protein